MFSFIKNFDVELIYNVNFLCKAIQLYIYINMYMYVYSFKINLF